MVIHLVVKTSHALNILAHHSIEIDRAAIGINDPRPDYLQAVLSVGDLGVINSNQARSLRNQEVFSRRRVVHVRAHQRFYLARQVGINSLLKDGWNVPAHFHFVLTKRQRAGEF